MNQTSLRTQKIAFLALLLALIFVLMLVERMLPPLPFLPPNMNIGLSNVVIMFSLFFVGKRECFTLVVLKALFNVMMRGPIAGLLSLSGGLLSVLVIIFFVWLFKDKISYVALGIVGAIAHNVGQLLIFCFLMQSWLLFLYFSPVLLVSGSILGTLTGILLKVALPALQKAQIKFNNNN